jgi:PAS domain S-box-containing protein
MGARPTTMTGVHLHEKMLAMNEALMLGSLRQLELRTAADTVNALLQAEIDERRRVEGALRVSELRYRRLFETAQDGILILNADSGQIDDVNPFLTDMLGYTREQLLGNKLWEIGPFKDIEASKAEFRELQREAYVRYEDLPLETRTGKVINVEFVSNVYQVDGVRVVQCNIRDITKRRRAEDRIKDYASQIQVLSRRLVEAQETERRTIARELHDAIGQSLTVIQFNLQALLLSPGSKVLSSRLNDCLGVVDRMQEQVHDITLNLRPLILDDLGLEPALRWFTKQQAALVGLQARFHADPLKHRLNMVVETECFRVAQEALTNVVRHARAKTVNVELRMETGQLHLRVRDDGIGFDVGAVRKEAVRGASLGLLSMEERAALAGGGLEFKSAPKKGTEVHAWFPLRWQATLPEAKAAT